MKHKWMSIVFLGLLCLGLWANLATQDQEISYEERRLLKQAPRIDTEFLLSRESAELVEAYLLDQFWNRNEFLSMKTWIDQAVLHRADSNGIYEKKGHLFQMEYPLREDSIRETAKKMKEISKALFSEDANIVYAVIPDKAWLNPSRNSYLYLDYDRMTEILGEELSGMEYLALDSYMTLEDYYRTDLHWRQEKLIDVTEAIWEKFGIHSSLDDGMTTYRYEPFYGVYYSRAHAPGRGESLVWLTDEEIDSFQVTDYDEMKEIKDVVYAHEKLGTADSYELFFGGNSPLIVIDNPSCQKENRLVIFRDSFGSSIAPLLAKEYAQTILVDLRFIEYETVKRFVELENADVLFLWGQQVYNNSAMIR